MAVTPFELPFTKNEKRTTIGKLHGSVFIKPELLPIEVLRCRNREFRVFLRKIVENIKKFCSYGKIDADDAETHFRPIIDCSSDATGVTRGQGVVLRRMGGRGHFRSRDKECGHTIRFAISENPRCTQTPPLYFL